MKKNKDLVTLKEEAGDNWGAVSLALLRLVKLSEKHKIRVLLIDGKRLANIDCLRRITDDYLLTLSVNQQILAKVLPSCKAQNLTALRSWAVQKILSFLLMIKAKKAVNLIREKVWREGAHVK